MFLLQSIILVAFSVLTLLQGISAQLQTCPSGESTYTYDDGSVFQSCPGTDYQGTTSAVIESVASAALCATECQKRASCKNSVYDSTGRRCHIKAGTLRWVTNTQYEAIRVVGKSAKGTQITACPYGLSNNTASGTTYQVCPGTDYRGTTSRAQNVKDQPSCFELCRSTTGCTRAVFDKKGSICHLKSGSVSWVTDGNFDTILITGQQPTPGEGTVVTACPSSESNQDIQGVRYTTCPGTDFRGNTLQVSHDVVSLAQCLQICANLASCTRSVYNPDSRVCYIKDAASALAWTIAKSFTTIYTQPKANDSSGTLGKWSKVISLPVIPVAAYVVPEYPSSSRVLMFSSWGVNNFAGPTGITQFADYNFVTGAVSRREVTNTKHDMFCPGISSIADGRIVITGGSNAEAVSIYDPVTNQFTRGQDMRLPRGYQTSATTSRGNIFTIGGSFTGGIGGKVGEIFDASTSNWTLLPGAEVTPILTTDREGAWRTDNHAWLFGWRDNWVFQAGPSKAMHWYNTAGRGSYVSAGTRDSAADAMCGVHVMYDIGKIFSAGGSQDYTDSPATTRAHLITIDRPGQPVNVERLPDLRHPRGFANAVVLPDGTVLITGGQRTSRVFSDLESVFTPELFDPKTKTFRELALESVPRNYHSVAILLADGTVFSGGGGLCPTAYGRPDDHCNRAVDHMDAQIFSPPYLFRADGSPAPRPQITTLSSDSSTGGGGGVSVRVGGTLTVETSDTAPVVFSLVRMGSVTHSVNSDQRRISVTNIVSNGRRHTLRLPNDSGVLIPGPYYLFALSSQGTPSIARTVRVVL